MTIKIRCELDSAIEYFYKMIYETVFYSTPSQTSCFHRSPKWDVNASEEVRKLLQAKKRLRKGWQHTCLPVDKTNLNRATAELKHKIDKYKNDSFCTFMQNLNYGNADYVTQNAVNPFKQSTKWMGGIQYHWFVDQKWTGRQLPNSICPHKRSPGKLEIFLGSISWRSAGFRSCMALRAPVQN